MCNGKQVEVAVECKERSIWLAMGRARTNTCGAQRAVWSRQDWQIILPRCHAFPIVDQKSRGRMLHQWPGLVLPKSRRLFSPCDGSDRRYVVGFIHGVRRL